MNKKLWIILIIVVLAVVAAGFYTSMNRTKPLKVETTDLAPTTMPNGFAADLPSETGSMVKENYEATTNDGRHQSTRVFTTFKALDEAVKVYSQYFTTQGWVEIETQNVNSNLVNILMKKENDTLLISGRNNETLQEKTVSLTLTEAPKTQTK